jgi:3-oxoacyl-[acyl-carrier-protein] synthase II
MQDVVITGIGLRTPMGHTLDRVREVFRSGRPVVRGFEAPDGRLRAGARMDDDFTIGFTKSELALFDPVALIALVASDDLIADSGLALDALDRERVGVFLGTGQGALHAKYEAFTALALRDRMSGYAVLRGLDNGATNQISIRHDLRGACETTVQACSSSNIAMGNAMRAIRHGYLDVAIAGGVDAPFTEGNLRAWEAMRVLATFDPANAQGACRPFSKDRAGLVLGEGAVLYTFESAAHARARGARVYARVAGYATSSDAKHISSPDARGQAACLSACMADAGLETKDVGYINCHGTATPVGDPVEVASIRQVFGSRAELTPASATKSLHGHTLGAAGALELMACIVALNDGVIAPTANLDVPDPACDLDFVPIHARTGVKLDATLSTSFAFGGTNACIALVRG